MPSPRIVDLRGKGRRKPPAGQRSLFSSPPSGGPRRSVPLRAKRRRKRIYVAVAVALLCAGAVWGVGYLSYLPGLSIQTITVSGAKEVPAELIEQYAETVLDDGSHHFLSRKNIFLFPRAVLERAIEGYFPRILSVQVIHPYFSTTIQIIVKERQLFAFWCREPGAIAPAGEAACYQMDESGFLFAEAPDITGTSVRAGTRYVFTGPVGIASTSPVVSNPIGLLYAPGHVPGITTLLRLIGQAGVTPLGAELDTGQDFVVPLAEGFYIKASFGEDAGTLSRNLQLVLSSDILQDKKTELEYIDLRFGDRVYYKLKGEEQAGI